jgi:hypothetical protein
MLLATAVAIVTSLVVANATQTITTPNAAYVTYNLAAGTSSAAITPVTTKSVSVMGCCTALKSVTFHYKKEIDPERTPQFGLVAEEVEKVNPDLVVHDKEGKAYTVRYDAVNAMLLNEFLKEHKKVEDLQVARIAERKEIAELKQQLKVQAAAIQQVSDQLELSKPASRTVNNQ